MRDSERRDGELSGVLNREIWTRAARARHTTARPATRRSVVCILPHSMVEWLAGFDRPAGPMAGVACEASGKWHEPNVALKPDRDFARLVSDFPFPEKGVRPLPALPERDRIKGRSIGRKPCPVEATTMTPSARPHRWSDPVDALLIEVLGSPPIWSWAWDLKHHPEHARNMTVACQTCVPAYLPRLAMLTAKPRWQPEVVGRRGLEPRTSALSARRSAS